MVVSKQVMFLVFLVVGLIAAVTAFGSNDDRFIKKYAMMKIYESCFGEEVVKQIRKEMKAACAKCAALEMPSFAPPPPPTPKPTTSPPPEDRPRPDGMTDQENAIFANQPAFDADKLHQAIYAFRPNPVAPSYRPFTAGVPGYFPGYPTPYPGPMYFQGYQQPAYGASPYGLPFFNPAFVGSQRTSRDMDIRGQLEALTSRMSGRVRNVTCVMQELGYLDANLEPNFAKISERIGNLPIPEELKNDMQEGVTFCQQFSQCVPDIKKDKSPLSRELIRPMFFFKCYKHKKLEACIMKDVREKYAGVTDDDFDSGDMELRRTSKSAKMAAAEDKDVEELAGSMYEFLYGSDSNFDIENIL